MQAELCCYDLGHSQLVGALLDVTSCISPQSCFLELNAFPRGLITNLFLEHTGEKVKEWYKSHLEVPWQCSDCMLPAPPTSPYRQLIRGLRDVHMGSQVEERATRIAEVHETICQTRMPQKRMSWQSCCG